METNMKEVQLSTDEKSSSETALLEELDKLKEEMRAKFTDVCTKVGNVWSHRYLFFLSG